MHRKIEPFCGTHVEFWLNWFPFPSNGKVHRKFAEKIKAETHLPVSIPFKRKVHRKRIDDPSIANNWCCVSIPFKRESASKALEHRVAVLRDNKVSIPFKRESASKAIWRKVCGCRRCEFQFPSNGKVHRKKKAGWYTESIFPVIVSIPFKRESASKVDEDWDVLMLTHCEFPFPSNGKVHRKGPSKNGFPRFIEFPFPSNGKVHRKLHSPRRSQRQKRVSIPFKRESASKVRKKLFPATSIRYRAKTCFNSLQTGKCIESKYCFMHEVPHIVVFQFPSNGKVHRKSEKVVFRTIQLCFNSLQTGKCIERKPSNRLQRPAILFQFPSNGKVHRKFEK